MFVLGIDPGLTRCGFGLVEGSLEGDPLAVAVRAGLIETDPCEPVEGRLAQLGRDLARLYRELAPQVVVVERVFYQRNARTAIPVAQASGVAIALADGALVRQFTAQEVKLAVTGYGAADKAQVQAMVARLLGLREVPRPPDVADALALALTYLAVARTEARFPAPAS
ncbi:MAG: crossover junction endodeoxyribonuclease RuvC [Acidimicrobiales bacterium]